MPLTATTCSQCGAPKGMVNHWWLAWDERGGQRFCVVPWESDPSLAREQSVQKICGQTCLTVALSKWMGKVGK